MFIRVPSNLSLSLREGSALLDLAGRGGARSWWMCMLLSPNGRLRWQHAALGLVSALCDLVLRRSVSRRTRTDSIRRTAIRRASNSQWTCVARITQRTNLQPITEEARAAVFDPFIGTFTPLCKSHLRTRETLRDRCVAISLE